MRRLFLTVGLAALSLGLITGAWARATGGFIGTNGADVLKGTAKADKLDGRGGNDTLFGYGGNDVILGGTGNDKLVGGPGKDKLRCGPGKDTAVADAGDSIGADCEVVKGLAAPPAAPPPPPAPAPPAPPPPPAVRAVGGHYCGFTNQGKSICFDVVGDSTRVANFATTSDVDCSNASATFGLSFDDSTAIQSDLSFTFTYNGPIRSGSPDLTNINTRYTVSGKFDTAGNATGTLGLSSLSFDYKGTHYDCAAAGYAWQARAGA